MSKKASDSVTVAFRLTPDEHRELLALAESHRQTAGTCARQLVLDAIRNRNADAWREEWRLSMSHLNQKLGLFASVLLTNKLPLPPEAVAEWVKATWLNEEQRRETTT